MIFKLLGKREINLFFVVIFFMIVSACIEALSISLVLPIIQLINNFENNSLIYFDNYLFFNTLVANQKVTFILIIFLLIFFFKIFLFIIFILVSFLFRI